jgi:predicted O-linked N-acetylglucosamine transferase (SPINDLY family)
MEIDIAVDLMGYTTFARTGVFARRPAPVQVNFLGYPGTMATEYIDYMIADRAVIPESSEKFYTEALALMPATFFPTDPKKLIAGAPSRAECGLPENAFVFCSFNGLQKHTPEFFDVWMRLLKVVEGSVLWLLDGPAEAGNNLKAEAEKRGVESARLIFAPRTAPADHLARQANADLFLDSLPYNAHTTTTDALWAGLPILTCAGASMSARVAASLLAAAGLPELITGSLEDYENLALALARDAKRLAGIREKLAGNRATFPLFDTARYTRDLESAYRIMWERAQRGERPESFAVPAAGR